MTSNTKANVGILKNKNRNSIIVRREPTGEDENNIHRKSTSFSFIARKATNAMVRKSWSTKVASQRQVVQVRQRRSSLLDVFSEMKTGKKDKVQEAKKETKVYLIFERCGEREVANGENLFITKERSLPDKKMLLDEVISEDHGNKLLDDVVENVAKLETRLEEEGISTPFRNVDEVFPTFKELHSCLGAMSRRNGCENVSEKRKKRELPNLSQREPCWSSSSSASVTTSSFDSDLSISSPIDVQHNLEVEEQLLSDDPVGFSDNVEQKRTQPQHHFQLSDEFYREELERTAAKNNHQQTKEYYEDEDDEEHSSCLDSKGNFMDLYEDLAFLANFMYTDCILNRHPELEDHQKMNSAFHPTSLCVFQIKRFSAEMLDYLIRFGLLSLDGTEPNEAREHAMYLEAKRFLKIQIAGDESKDDTSIVSEASSDCDSGFIFDLITIKSVSDEDQNNNCDENTTSTSNKSRLSGRQIFEMITNKLRKDSETKHLAEHSSSNDLHENSSSRFSLRKRAQSLVTGVSSRITTTISSPKGESKNDLIESFSTTEDSNKKRTEYTSVTTKISSRNMNKLSSLLRRKSDLTPKTKSSSQIAREQSEYLSLKELISHHC